MKYCLEASPLACFVLFLFPYSSFADFTSPVVSVLDGDTIDVLHNQRPERIRLSGIDCPEKGQAFGKRAKQAASKLVYGKEVTIQTHGHDKYKRILADVILPDGKNLNHELVKQGWCWWYRKYAPGDTVLQLLEAEAREGKKGLWVDPAPIPPWVYRKVRRGQAPDIVTHCAVCRLNNPALAPSYVLLLQYASLRGPLNAILDSSPHQPTGRAHDQKNYCADRVGVISRLQWGRRR